MMERMSELSVTNVSLTSIKRKLENDVQALHVGVPVFVAVFVPVFVFVLVPVHIPVHAFVFVAVFASVFFLVFVFVFFCVCPCACSCICFCAFHHLYLCLLRFLSSRRSINVIFTHT